LTVSGTAQGDEGVGGGARLKRAAVEFPRARVPAPVTEKVLTSPPSLIVRIPLSVAAVAIRSSFVGACTSSSPPC
jgi:hypothetical protein